MENPKVNLKSKVVGETKSKDPKEQSFELKQANALLQLPNSRWELADKAFEWNGKELKAAESKGKAETTK